MPAMPALPGGQLSSADVAALRAQQSELGRQLESADSRRRELLKELRRADGAERAGITQRLQVLDQRILQLESGLASTGQQLAAARGLAGTTEQPVSFGRNAGVSPKDFEDVGVVFTIFVLMPLAVAFARRLWKRPTPAPIPPSLLEAANRLEHLQQAVDAIAIEVERVSEGQRFVTKLLSERAAQPGAPGLLGAGEAPVFGASQANGEREPVRAKPGER